LRGLLNQLVLLTAEPCDS